jgi:hypothetical protein
MLSKIALLIILIGPAGTYKEQIYFDTTNQCEIAKSRLYPHAFTYYKLQVSCIPTKVKIS